MGELLRSMTAREYDDWKRFAALEPFGGQRGDAQAALIAMTTARAVGGAKNAKLADFLLDYDAPPETPMTEEQLTRIQDWKERARALRKQAS